MQGEWENKDIGNHGNTGVLGGVNPKEACRETEKEKPEKEKEKHWTQLLQKVKKRVSSRQRVCFQ